MSGSVCNGQLVCPCRDVGALAGKPRVAHSNCPASRITHHASLSMKLSDRSRDLLLLLGLCFLCFFFRLGAVGLYDFNEGFYAQAAREIYLRGDFVTPRVNGIYFFDKPP